MADLSFYIFKMYISTLRKILHKEEICWQKLMNDKLQNTYQIVKVLEASMFWYIFGYIFE